MRRGALHNEAIRLGCNKTALGHSLDDWIETFFLSLFYESRIHAFAPVTHLDRKNIHAIRPLMYAPESDIVGFAKKYGLPITKNPCPADGHTKRAEIKAFVKAQTARDPAFPKRMQNAMQQAAFFPRKDT